MEIKLITLRKWYTTYEYYWGRSTMVVRHWVV